LTLQTSATLSGPNDQRMLRTVGAFEPIRDHFGLGVNYSAAIVNRHRLEAYDLDTSGRVVAVAARRRWSHDALLERARSLLPATSDECARGERSPCQSPISSVAPSEGTPASSSRKSR
jgi:hypothetical protein